jgi:hypothetical protein
MQPYLSLIPRSLPPGRTSDYIAGTGAYHSDQDRPHPQDGAPVAAKHRSQFADDAHSHGANDEGDVWSKG